MTLKRNESDILRKRLIDEIATLSTSNISDAADRFGVKSGCHGIKPVVKGTKIAGTAFTIKYVAASVKPGSVGDYIDSARAGDVIVIDNNGRTDCTVWGDLLTLRSKTMGLSGTVIDGVCRDVPTIEAMRYPVFSRGCFMVTGKDRVQLDQANVPVSISGVRVQPGDIVVADDSGVVIVPSELAQDILTAAKEIARAEELIESEIRKGATLSEARGKVGYHSLQRRS
jgi:4-hydroxy-4-methyl-2-oxoglutarate aldolase